MDQNQLNRFLAKIAQIESAGGKYTNHQLIKHGLQKGYRAIGTYGLMPNTIADVIQRQQNSGEITPEVAALKGLSQEDLKTKLEANPELQTNLASTLAKKVLENQAGNEDKAAYAWNMGHNLPSNRITPTKLASHDYVQKFRKLKNLVPVGQVAQQNPNLDDLLQSDTPSTTPQNSNLDDLLEPVKGYSHGGIVKATAQEEASKNPMNYIQTHKNMSIKNVKGVAF